MKIELKKEAFRFVKFNLVGVANTAVDFSVFCLLTFWGVYYMVAQVISYTCGIINSFVLNRYWTFEMKGTPKGGEAIKFLSVNLVSMGVSLAALYGLRVFLGVLLAKGAATALAALVNFTGNRFWVFAPGCRIKHLE
ncbi:MAG TPA: GtrA family protein [Moorella mulderi]|nr:GtrA family protein [Moorella mulderi]